MRPRDERVAYAPRGRVGAQRVDALEDASDEEKVEESEEANRHGDPCDTLCRAECRFWYRCSCCCLCRRHSAYVRANYIYINNKNKKENKTIEICVR